MNNKITKVLSGHFNPNLGKDYLLTVFELFKKIKQEGNLKQGTGVHEYKGLEVIL